jgi:hypothetical protein
MVVNKGLTTGSKFRLDGKRPDTTVGITIRNEFNVSDKAVGISFRRKHQLLGDAITALFAKVV